MAVEGHEGKAPLSRLSDRCSWMRRPSLTHPGATASRRFPPFEPGGGEATGSHLSARPDPPRASSIAVRLCRYAPPKFTDGELASIFEHPARYLLSLAGPHRSMQRPLTRPDQLGCPHRHVGSRSHIIL